MASQQGGDGIAGRAIAVAGGQQIEEGGQIVGRGGVAQQRPGTGCPFRIGAAGIRQQHRDHGVAAAFRQDPEQEGACRRIGVLHPRQQGAIHGATRHHGCQDGPYRLAEGLVAHQGDEGVELVFVAAGAKHIDGGQAHRRDGGGEQSGGGIGTQRITACRQDAASDDLHRCRPVRDAVGDGHGGGGAWHGGEPARGTHHQARVGTAQGIAQDGDEQVAFAGSGQGGQGVAAARAATGRIRQFAVQGAGHVHLAVPSPPVGGEEQGLVADVGSGCGTQGGDGGVVADASQGEQGGLGDDGIAIADKGGEHRHHRTIATLTEAGDACGALAARGGSQGADQGGGGFGSGDGLQHQARGMPAARQGEPGFHHRHAGDRSVADQTQAGGLAAEIRGVGRRQAGQQALLPTGGVRRGLPQLKIHGTDDGGTVLGTQAGEGDEGIGGGLGALEGKGGKQRAEQDADSRRTLAGGDQAHDQTPHPWRLVRPSRALASGSPSMVSSSGFQRMRRPVR